MQRRRRVDRGTALPVDRGTALPVDRGTAPSQARCAREIFISLSGPMTSRSRYLTGGLDVPVTPLALR